MKPASLRFRLLTGAAVAIFVGSVVAGLMIIWLFGQHVNRREVATLTRHAETLVLGLRTAPSGGVALDRLPSDPHFLEPAGHLYWQVSNGRVILRSRSLWDQSLPPAVQATAAWASRTTAGPYGERVLVVERAIASAGSAAPVVVQVAVDTRALDAQRKDFELEVAGFLVVLWAVLWAATLIQVRLGLQPLADIRYELERMRRNPAARLSDGYPREITPLAEAINAMAVARQIDLERARRRAADLAHSLKTPLAALSAQTRRAREEGAQDAAQALEHSIAAVGAALEGELARARAAATRSYTHDRECSVAAVAERLIDVIERTDDGARIAFDLQIGDGVQAPVPEDALMEILGALLENAARHARRIVSLTAASGPQGVVVRVEDDGPGLDDEKMQVALVRGGRLDEAGSGHGLGLAIVRDSMEATDGSVSLGRSSLGGLAVDLVWPA